MLDKLETNNKIKILNDEIAILRKRKIEYQEINRDINDTESDFNDMKASIIKAQNYLKEGDSSDITALKINEMEKELIKVKGIIKMLEEIKVETDKELIEIDIKISEKEAMIRDLNSQLI